MSKQTDLHQRLLERIDVDFDQSQENQKESYDDRRFCFVSGAQWDGDIGRQFEGRPKFEFNKIQLSVIRIYNEWAKNRFTVEFRPKNHIADADTAETLQNLFRADERDSNADEAYSTAFFEGISGGISAVMLKAEYEDEYSDEDDHQRIRIKPIFEADTCVYWDANAKRYDKADANHVTIVTSMSKSAFEAKYHKEPCSFDNLQGMRFDWRNGDSIKVAEHYELTENKVDIIKLEHEHADPVTLDVPNKKDAEEVAEFEQELDSLLAQGYEVVLEKKIKRRVVKGYVLDGSGIIEKLGVIAGDYLPIAPFYGKRMYISGREVTQGHVRLSRDAQIAYNVKMSGLIDLASRPQDEIPIFTPAQIAGHEFIWANKEVKRKPYLTINPTKDGNGNMVAVGPQAYTKSPQIPQAMGALIDKAGQDIAELTGNQANGEQLVSNVSTQAVEMVQDKVDAQAYIYLDNFAKTMAHVGRIWLSMAKTIYDEEQREMTGLTHDDQDVDIVINKPTIKDGKLAYENDLQGGTYKVTVDVGEAFATQRDKTIKRLLNLVPMITDPQQQSALLNTILANQEGEGLQDLRKWARKNLISMQIVEPNEEEQKELAAAQAAASQQPPSAQDQWMEAEAAKAHANAEKAKADVQKTLAEVDETRADTAKTMFEIQKEQQQVQQTMEQMMAILQAMQQSQMQSEQQIKQEVTPPPMPPMGEMPAPPAGMPDIEQMPPEELMR
ncbi:portal protein [Psychrobacter pygoscelis]|uniref:portal protein n=1 Tax=Psychrobacter pygoscelis TaxID=2488563 RepID=UPI00103EA1C2|nr:portal protein [Psychrobacter pygoscelis]